MLINFVYFNFKGANIGIDDEDDSTFTISCDQKTFHFQGTSDHNLSIRKINVQYRTLSSVFFFISYQQSFMLCTFGSLKKNFTS